MLFETWRKSIAHDQRKSLVNRVRSYRMGRVGKRLAAEGAPTGARSNYQITSMSNCCIARSQLIKASFSSFDCAANMRSNGSRCSTFHDPAFSA